MRRHLLKCLQVPPRFHLFASLNFQINAAVFTHVLVHIVEVNPVCHWNYHDLTAHFPWQAGYINGLDDVIAGITHAVIHPTYIGYPVDHEIHFVAGDNPFCRIVFELLALVVNRVCEFIQLAFAQVVIDLASDGAFDGFQRWNRNIRWFQM